MLLNIFYDKEKINISVWLVIYFIDISKFFYENICMKYYSILWVKFEYNFFIL